MDLFDLGIEPVVLTDCCAITGDLQAHPSRSNSAAISAQLRDAGLGDGSLLRRKNGYPSSRPL